MCTCVSCEMAKALRNIIILPYGTVICVNWMDSWRASLIDDEKRETFNFGRRFQWVEEVNLQAFQIRYEEYSVRIRTLNQPNNEQANLWTGTQSFPLIKFEIRWTRKKIYSKNMFSIFSHRWVLSIFRM